MQFWYLEHRYFNIFCVPCVPNYCPFHIFRNCNLRTPIHMIPYSVLCTTYHSKLMDHLSIYLSTTNEKLMLNLPNHFWWSDTKFDKSNYVLSNNCKTTQGYIVYCCDYWSSDGDETVNYTICKIFYLGYTIIFL